MPWGWSTARARDGRRPLPVTLVGWLFIVAGAVGLAYHAREVAAPGGLNAESAWVLVLRVLAVVGGVGLLRAWGWARWLVLVWLAYHVVLSAGHEVSALIVHTILLAGVAYFLLRRETSAYFSPDGVRR